MKINQINLSPIAWFIKFLTLILMLAAFQSVAAQTLATDIPTALAPMAQELGCNSKTECATVFDQNFNKGVQIGIKYDVYKNDQKKQDLATTYQNEVLARLTSTSSANTEEEIIKIAKELIAQKPALAKGLGVSTNNIQAADIILTEVKKNGVDLNVCQKSEDDLSIDELRACLKAAKNLSTNKTITNNFIPKDRLDNPKFANIDNLASLGDALKNGDYSQLGQITPEQAGLKCLQPGSESITDCNKIAQQFFGSEGVNKLAAARADTNQVKDYYASGINKMALQLPDGQKILGLDAIKMKCENAFNAGNLATARACGEMAVRVGLSTKADMESGLQTLASFSAKSAGQNINFNECSANPNACQGFLPDNIQGQYKSNQQILQTMSNAIGFDPAQCATTTDPNVALQCLKGAQMALPKIRELSANSPDAQNIISGIEQRISEGQSMADRVKTLITFPQIPQQGIGRQNQGSIFSGPGGCSTPQACFQFCSDVANSAICLSFGAQQNIFKGDEAVKRFQQVSDTISSSYFGQQGPFVQPSNQIQNQSQTQQSAQNQLMTPPFQQGQFNTNQFSNQSGQFPMQQQGQFNQFPGPQQNMPSPACFEAIRSGNFEIAKSACAGSAPSTTQTTQQPFPVCPAAFPSPCSEGQYRTQTNTYNGCPSFGACAAIPGYQPSQQPLVNTSDTTKTGLICPSLPTVSECPVGQIKVVTFSSPQCGEFYTCQNNSTQTNMTPSTGCTQVGGTWNSTTNFCQMPNQTTQTSSCASGQYWNGTACVTSTVQTVGSCNYSTQYWKASTSQCQPRTSCYDTTNSDYNSQECQGVRGTTQPVGSGCGSLTSQTTCQAVSGCGWANGACGGNMTTGGSNCPSGQWWDGTACTSTMTTGGSNCSSGQYWNGTACVANMTPSTGCTQVGGTWNSTTNFCQMPNQTTQTSSCASGQYWNGTACVSSNTTNTTGMNCTNGQWWDGTACTSTMTTGGSNCSSGQYWNGTACVNSTTMNTDPSVSCAQAGGAWTNNFCQMPNTTYTPPPTDSSTPPPSTYTPPPTTSFNYVRSIIAMCQNTGGIWAGGACDLSGEIRARLARQTPSSSLIAQVFNAFGSVFSNRTK